MLYPNIVHRSAGNTLQRKAKECRTVLVRKGSQTPIKLKESMVSTHQKMLEHLISQRNQVGKVDGNIEKKSLNERKTFI